MSPSTKRKKWSNEAKCCAVRFVRSGDTVYLRASKYFSVPTGILERKYPVLQKMLVNVHLGELYYPVSLRVKFRVLRNYGPKILCTEMSGNKTHGFSVDNKKWFEKSV
jgi:hypothetical protein